jgi:hypothetical protein
MRLHVDRPCQVHRQHDGRWGWQCTLCPLPLCLIVTTAADWRSAYVEAARHVRVDHTNVSRAALAA